VQLDSRITDVAHVIQLAVAPVFLLSGVGVTLTVLTNRLARIIDRARALETRLLVPSTAMEPEVHDELALLARRARLVSLAITLSTTCALLISVMIATLFVGAFLSVDLSRLIAALFIIAMLAFVGALVGFLREIFLATASLRFGVDRKP
jgi:hypothetical protein